MAALVSALESLLFTVEGETARFSFQVPEGLWCLAGHFPGAPLVPAFVQIDWLRVVFSRCYGRPIYFPAVNSAKWVSPLGPGDKVHGEIIRASERGSWKAQLFVEDRLVLSAAGTYEEASRNRFCAVIPCFNHGGTVGGVVEKVLAHGLPAVVVNDGSSDSTAAVLRGLHERYGERVKIIALNRNSGKGAALAVGFCWAFENGFSHALQIDADGQHEINDIPLFLTESKRNPDALILGQPVFDSSAPRARVWGRKVSTFLVWAETGSRAAADALCGFRLYPLGATVSCVREESPGRRMQFDPEILVRLAWRKVPIVNVLTAVSYPQAGISHFRYLRDNLSMVLLHLRLWGTLLRKVFRGDRHPPKRIRMTERAPLPLEASSEVRVTMHSASRRFPARASAPSGEHWASMAERGSLFSLTFLIWLYRICGRRFLHAAMWPIAAYFVVFGGKAVRSSRAYLRRVRSYTGHSAESAGAWLMLQHFKEFAIAIVDKLAAWAGDVPLIEIRWHDPDDLKTKIFSGRGGILLGAHLGNIEVLRALTQTLPNLRITALMYTRHAARFNAMLRAINADALIRIFPLEDISPERILELKARIAEGEIVAILADRVGHGAPDRKVYCRFLGDPAPFPEGPFVLASLLDCPVYLSLCLRGKDGVYDAYFDRFADRLVFPRKDRASHIHTAVSRFAAALERYCAGYPLQWFNFYDFWEDETRQSSPEAATEVSSMAASELTLKDH